MPEQNLCPLCDLVIDLENENYVVRNKVTHPEDSEVWVLVHSECHKQSKQDDGD